MSESNFLIKEAYKKGYRVTEDGKLISCKGKVLTQRLCKGARYPKFSFSYNGERKTINTHRFAAYCFFGDEVFYEGIQVRHLNANTLDFSINNLALGTAKDNDGDKTVEARKRSTEGVRKASLGRPPVNRKLSNADVRHIKEELSKGTKGTLLAKRFGVSNTTITNIKQNKYYKTERKIS